MKTERAKVELNSVFKSALITGFAVAPVALLRAGGRPWVVYGLDEDSEAGDEGDDGGEGGVDFCEAGEGSGGGVTQGAGDSVTALGDGVMFDEVTGEVQE